MMVWRMLAGSALGLAMITGCSGGGGSGDSPPAATSGNATINLNPTTFSLSVTQGDPNPVHTVEISNSGHDTLDWSVSSSAPWLSVSPSSGKSSGDIPTSFTATANISGLTPGTYSGTITVIGDAINTPQAIPATLIISPIAASTTPPPATSTSGPTSAPPPPTSSNSTPPTSAPPPAASPSSTPPTVSVGIAWDAIGPAVSGYYVHYGTQSPTVGGSCAYSQSVYYSLAALPNASAPTATISGLTTGGTYYFAVSAYDGTRESPCSNEIWKSM